MRGVSGRPAVGGGVCVPQMRLSSRVSVVQRSVPVRRVPPSNVSNGGTVLHKTHIPLTQWFLTFYFMSQDKRGISAVQLASMLSTKYKTAWYMLRRIRAAMGQRDATYQLSGVIEFDDAYFGGPTVGKKRGRGTEKAKLYSGVGGICP